MNKKKNNLSELLAVGNKISLKKLIKITDGIRINVLSSYKDPNLTDRRSYKGHYFAIDKEEMLKSIESLWGLHKKRRWVRIITDSFLNNGNNRAIHVEIIGDRKPKNKNKPLKKKKNAKSKIIQRKSKGRR